MKNTRKSFRWAGLQVAAVAAALSLGAGPAGFAEEPRSVPSVIGAFNGLSTRADGLAIRRGPAPEATTCKHHQGLARYNAPDGTPYMVFTRSGNQFSGILCSGGDEPGSLFIARMDSRDKHGERLRTNLMPYFVDGDRAPLGERPHVIEDDVVRVIQFDGTGGWPAYRHPGGMQIADGVAVIGVEEPYGSETDRAIFVFVDLSDPENPRMASRFHACGAGGCGPFGTDPVGLTQIKADDGSCCRYLMVGAGGAANEQVRFFRSLPTPPSATTTDLKSPLLDWEEVGRYSESAIEDCLGADWPTSGAIQGGQHQLLNFVREGDLDGPLYLLGGRRDGTISTPFVDELLELYRVNVGADGTMPATCPLTFVGRKTMGEETWGERTYSGSFSAGSGVYVSPSGELIVYVSRHDSTEGVIVMGEFRISSLVRATSPPSPALRPSAKVIGPIVVDEGATTPITGQGRQAVQKAYIQLFEDGGSGATLTDDRWLNIEFTDRDELPFHDLERLGLTDFFGFEEMFEQASSWRWFAPVGCTISANDYESASDEWPGPDTVLLRGRGRVEEDQSLSSVPVFQPDDELWPVTPVPADEIASNVDYHDDVAGVTFYHQVPYGDDQVATLHDCEIYYNKIIGLDWDLDGNGTYEANGTTVTFNAAWLDGPRTATVKARAKHPTDNTALGIGEPNTVSVTVRNVPPRIAFAGVTDPLGRNLVGTVHRALPGLPAKLAVDFTDPGFPDTQTGFVAWGDGTFSSTFTTFSDARNGGVGHLQQAHAFLAPGLRTIVATITDDDLGATPVAQTIEVVSLVSAVQDVANQLTQRIAQTTNNRIITPLVAARDDLIGTHNGSGSNGAIDRLLDKELVPALTKVRAAIVHLITAESRGSGSLSLLKDNLGLIGEAMAADLYAQAVAATPDPPPRKQRTLDSIRDLIAEGHVELLSGEHLSACDLFKRAANQAMSLLR